MSVFNIMTTHELLQALLAEFRKIMAGLEGLLAELPPEDKFVVARDKCRQNIESFKVNLAKLEEMTSDGHTVS
jgi:hypothetical protein